MWALFKFILKTAVISSSILLFILVVANPHMTDQFMEFIVIGEIPGSNYLLNYQQILLAAGLIIGAPCLYSISRRAIKRHWLHKGIATSAEAVRQITEHAKPLTAQLIGHTAVALQANTSADWLNPLE